MDRVSQCDLQINYDMVSNAHVPPADCVPLTQPLHRFLWPVGDRIKGCSAV